jgi:hypothetical protein
MRTQTLGDKPAFFSFRAKNAESSDSITAGAPVAFVMNATGDGFDVVLPATATAAKATRLGFGVALETIATAHSGEVQVYGFCRNSAMIVRTRSASDAVWASMPGFSVSQVLTINTVGNGFATAAVPASYVTGTAGSDTLALALDMFMPYAILCESRASVTTAASTTSFVATVSTALVKTFLRML